MMDIAVTPSEHGHAMIKTDTAFTIAPAIAGAGPQTHQMMKAASPSHMHLLRVRSKRTANWRRVGT
jgi:hypothetical protein